MQWWHRMTAPTFVENIARELLARDGASAVWELHLAAAKAYRNGCTRAAEALVMIADAAEGELANRGGYSTIETIE
jgi:hypothetical protein